MFKAFLLMLFGLGYAGFSVKNMMDDSALAERGKTAVVQPIEAYSKTTYKRTNRVEYDADISFVTDSGATVTTRKRLTVELLDRFALNQPVSIRYLPDNPKVNRIGVEGKAGGLDIGLGLLAFVIGFFWFRRASNAPSRLKD
jgi:hypothetical protein